MALTGESNGWKNHPATKMWDGYEIILCYYGIEMSTEWLRRGYVDNLKPWFQNKILELRDNGHRYTENPWFIGNEIFHRSHQSNLMRKLPEYYHEYFPDVPDDLPYVWTLEEANAEISLPA